MENNLVLIRVVILLIKDRLPHTGGESRGIHFFTPDGVELTLDMEVLATWSN